MKIFSQIVIILGMPIIIHHANKSFTTMQAEETVFHPNPRRLPLYSKRSALHPPCKKLKIAKDGVLLRKTKTAAKHARLLVLKDIFNKMEEARSGLPIKRNSHVHSYILYILFICEIYYHFSTFLKSLS